MNRFIIILLTFGIICNSCNYIPCSASSDLSKLSEAPEHVSAAGGYEPDSFTKQDHKEYAAAKEPFLILSEDGTIFLNNFPRKTFAADQEPGSSTITGSGTWAFEKGKETINIKTSLSFKQQGITQPPPFQLYKKDNKFYILIELGDPDNCNAVRLVQQ